MMETVSSRDALHRFLFEGTPVRGALVRLDESVRQARGRGTMPDAVWSLLGEALVATVLLGSVLKQRGSVSLQIEAGGPVPFLVARSTHRREVRATARWRGEVPEGPLESKTGSGRLAITIDPGEGEPYQGIVDLARGSLAAAIEAYFAASEQIETRLWIVAEGGRSAGLLLQKLPGAVHDPDLWNRLVIQARTARPGELIDLAERDLLRRLFPEDDIRPFAAEPVRYRCGCERETIGALIRAMGRTEAERILATEGGAIEASCQYCDALYRFDAVDVAAVFAASPASAPPSTRQ